MLSRVLKVMSRPQKQSMVALRSFSSADVIALHRK